MELKKVFVNRYARVNEEIVKAIVANPGNCQNILIGRDVIEAIIAQERVEIDEERRYETGRYMLETEELKMNFTPVFGTFVQVTAWSILFEEDGEMRRLKYRTPEFMAPGSKKMLEIEFES